MMAENKFQGDDIERGPFLPYAKCPCGRLFRDWTEFVGRWPIWENALCDVCSICGEPRSKRIKLSARKVYRIIPRVGLAALFGLSPIKTPIGMEEKTYG